MEGLVHDKKLIINHNKLIIKLLVVYKTLGIRNFVKKNNRSLDEESY